MAVPLRYLRFARGIGLPKMRSCAAVPRSAACMPHLWGTLGDAPSAANAMHRRCAGKGWKSFPLDGCASALMLSAESKRIVTAFKDRGEQQLSAVIAQHLADMLPCSWAENALLVPIPARKNAIRQRGFDHVSLIVSELSRITGIPSANALCALPRRDQRALDARERLTNMAGSFALNPAVAREQTLKRRMGARTCIILIDDVFTTGATLFTAAEALRPLLPEKNYALTFIRA